MNLGRFRCFWAYGTWSSGRVGTEAGPVARHVRLVGGQMLPLCHGVGALGLDFGGVDVLRARCRTGSG